MGITMVYGHPNFPCLIGLYSLLPQANNSVTKAYKNIKMLTNDDLTITNEKVSDVSYFEEGGGAPGPGLVHLFIFNLFCVFYHLYSLKFKWFSHICQGCTIIDL